MPTLVVRLPDGSENEYDVVGELKIGRQQGNDLLLTEGGVSRNHAVVFEDGGTVYIEDKGSANGTFVDGERIAEPTPLTPESEVVLGDYTLRLKPAAPSRSTGPRRSTARVPATDDEMPVGSEGSGARATRALPSMKARPPAGAAGAPKRPSRPAGGAGAAAPAGGGGAGPMLRGLVGPWAGRTYPLKGKVLVGRQPPAVVLLEDDSVSRRHAELVATASGVTVKDLGSANGTLLNGEPLGQEPVPLQPGDQLQFGVVELSFEAAEEEAPAALARRGSGPIPTRRGGAAAEAEQAPAAAGRKKLLVVAASVVGLLVVAGLVKAVLPGADPGTVARPPAAVEADPAQQIQELLSECRSYASSELGEPNWARAEEVCTKALDLDPIHAEANTLIRRIKLEKESFEYYSIGEKLLQRLKPEEALEAFSKIQKESEYFRKAKSKAREAAEQVTKRAQEDCKRYLGDSQWSAAVPRCQQYMAVWCQGQSRESLVPPLGYSLKLEGRLRRNEWRPKDALFVRFLIARQKLDANAAPWSCPQTDIIGQEDTGTDPRAVVEAAVKKRFTNKLIQAAMMDYWAGRGSEAQATLQKLRSNYEAAQFHAQADEMLKVMTTVDQLYKSGQTFLAADEPEKAAEPFREALDTDKTLMLDLAESKPSFYRRNIHQDMADKSYQRGKHWADRQDHRRACRIWKLGFSFYAGNPDLNKAAAFCSGMAADAFRNAGGCSDLAAVLDYAVKGDGQDEKVEAKKKEWNCP
ncbi:FHA domain-containing protein [Myxococcus sp. RHSTA-1-4]|uniref:FHA domain-containing protein n=1 Tax=Myxococcus sp. RHSTA-1-4 TaxID=2874601 RepID=UPI001CBBC9FD|nr:FHA domain-containing protein [Myxococcus sp. RHSTA-1-4]MBZ4416607.1 FHA domain-containing protein [Myxococcus sp. RHSTA-1-4]